MQTIKPSNKAFIWILSPYRETFSSGAIRRWIETEANSHDARYVCVNGNNAAFSMYEGIDFGRTLTKVRSSNNYLYIERRQIGIVFVHIKEGNLIEDRVLSNDDSLFSALDLIVGARQRSNISNYDIDYFGFEDTRDLLEIFNSITGLEGSISELSNSLFDSIELSSLEDNEIFEFVEIESAVRDLADSNTQKITVGVVCAMLLTFFIFSSEFIGWEKTVERLNLVDDYSEFTNVMLNDSSFSARLSQDFNIHKVIKNELPDWSIYQVLHISDAIEYRLIRHTHFASMKNLNLFADHYGMAVVNDGNVISLVAGINKEEVFRDEYDIKRYRLNELTANIIDVLSDVTPFVSAKVSKNFSGDIWAKRDISLQFNGASSHDLLRVAAVVDGYPERYPTFFKNCQSQGCSYDVSPKGLIKGTMNFTIYGDIK